MVRHMQGAVLGVLLGQPGCPFASLPLTPSYPVSFYGHSDFCPLVPYSVLSLFQDTAPGFIYALRLAHCLHKSEVRDSMTFIFWSCCLLSAGLYLDCTCLMPFEFVLSSVWPGAGQGIEDLGEQELCFLTSLSSYLCFISFVN